MSSIINEHPHRRYNILTGEWILVSPQRTKRPWQGKTEKAQEHSRPEYEETCYLCPGNTRSNGEKNPNYEAVYTFENDFPALLPVNPSENHTNGLLEARPESGICKVVCFSPNHALTLPLMENEDIVKLIKLWKQELIELGRLPQINYVQIFENKGEIMGCSNPHPHGQIWSQNSIPNEILKKSRHQKEYWEKHQTSLLGDYLAQELEEKERILDENEHFVSLIPYWAVWPFEAMIIPRKAHSTIAGLNFEEEKAFAEIIKKLTIRYDNLFETSFPYSSGIHQAPTDGEEHPWWHFHLSFYPPLLRSATIKKFMVGYEMFAGPQRDITAEVAAQRLREVSLKHYSEED